MREVWIQSYKVKQKTEELPCSVTRTCREDFDAEQKSTNLQRHVFQIIARENSHSRTQSFAACRLTPVPAYSPSTRTIWPHKQ